MYLQHTYTSLRYFKSPPHKCRAGKFILLILSTCSNCCSLFQVKYDFILKAENLEEEEPFMLRQLNLTSDITGNENENPLRLSFEQKQGYFMLLNKNEMNGLYMLYKQDFDLFQYDPKIFD